MVLWEWKVPAQAGVFRTGRSLLGSTNPLAIDIIASRIAGYEPLVIPTNRIALFRKKWLQSESDIDYDGPEINVIIKKDFKKSPYPIVITLHFSLL